MLLRRLAIEIFIIAAIGVALGWLGPFGTFILPLPVRLIYWAGVVLIGYAFYRPVQSVARWLSEETAIPLWAALSVAAALAALPLTFIVGFVFSGMQYDAISGMQYNPAILGEAFPRIYVQVFEIGLAIQLAMRLLFGEPSPAAAPEAKPAPPSPLASRARSARLLAPTRLSSAGCRPRSVTVSSASRCRIIM